MLSGQSLRGCRMQRNLPLALTTGGIVFKIVDGISAVVLGEVREERLVLVGLFGVGIPVLRVARRLRNDGLLVIAEFVDDVLQTAALELGEKGNAIITETDTTCELKSVQPTQCARWPRWRR